MKMLVFYLKTFLLNKNRALTHIMFWCRTGAKPISEPTHIYIYHIYYISYLYISVCLCVTPSWVNIYQRCLLLCDSWLLKTPLNITAWHIYINVSFSRNMLTPWIPNNSSFVRGNHRSPVISFRKGHHCGALIFLYCRSGQVVENSAVGGELIWYANHISLLILKFNHKY